MWTRSPEAVSSGGPSTSSDRKRTVLKFSHLSHQQTAPYVALCGCTVKVVSENSPHCGQSGRVRRVFWRRGTAWVLVRLRLGGVISLPWDSTDLPVPQLEDDARPDGPPPLLLSPIALRDLARFLWHRKHNAAVINQFNG